MSRVPTFFSALARWQHYCSSLLLTEFLWWPCTSSLDGVLTREVLAKAPFSIGSLLKQLGLDLSQPIHHIHKGLVKTLWQSKKPHCSMHTNASVWTSTFSMSQNVDIVCLKTYEPQSCILCSYVHRWHSNVCTSPYRWGTNSRKVSQRCPDSARSN